MYRKSVIGLTCFLFCAIVQGGRLGRRSYDPVEEIIIRLEHRPSYINMFHPPMAMQTPEDSMEEPTSPDTSHSPAPGPQSADMQGMMNQMMAAMMAGMQGGMDKNTQQQMMDQMTQMTTNGMAQQMPTGMNQPMMTAGGGRDHYGLAYMPFKNVGGGSSNSATSEAEDQMTNVPAADAAEDVSDSTDRQTQGYGYGLPMSQSNTAGMQGTNSVRQNENNNEIAASTTGSNAMTMQGLMNMIKNMAAAQDEDEPASVTITNPAITMADMMQMIQNMAAENKGDVEVTTENNDADETTADVAEADTGESAASAVPYPYPSFPGHAVIPGSFAFLPFGFQRPSAASMMNSDMGDKSSESAESDTMADGDSDTSSSNEEDGGDGSMGSSMMSSSSNAGSSMGGYGSSMSVGMSGGYCVVEGRRMPDVSDVRYFQWCVNKRWMRWQCAEGTVFCPKINNCCFPGVNYTD